MFKKVSKLAIAAAAVAALPGVAHAGTATATGRAVLNVINQCTVTGKNVNLGTYTASNTWGQVGAALGSYNGTTYTPGSLGQEHLDFGSVTCDAGTPYTLSIKGGSSIVPGAISIAHNGKTATFLPGIKKLAGNVVADTSAIYAGTGAQVGTATLSATGTGTAQTLFGNVTLNFAVGGSAAPLATETLGVAGTANDTLTYTLNF